VENMMYRLSDLSGKETRKIRATSVPDKPRTPGSRPHARIHAIFLPDNTTAHPPQSDKLHTSSDKNCHRTGGQLPPPTAHARPREEQSVSVLACCVPTAHARPREVDPTDPLPPIAHARAIAPKRDSWPPFPRDGAGRWNAGVARRRKSGDGDQSAFTRKSSAGMMGMTIWFGLPEPPSVAGLARIFSFQ
jgi:hypothetical protein